MTATLPLRTASQSGLTPQSAIAPNFKHHSVLLDFSNSNHLLSLRVVQPLQPLRDIATKRSITPGDITPVMNPLRVAASKAANMPRAIRRDTLTTSNANTNQYNYNRNTHPHMSRSTVPQER